MGREIWIRACGCLGIGFRMRWMSELQDFQKHAKTGKFLFHGENGFLKNVRFIVLKPQTALTKMTARNVRRYHVFIKKCQKPLFLQVKPVFFMKTMIFNFVYEQIISLGNHVLATCRMFLCQ